MAVLYVTPKNDAHKAMLVEQYEMLGYYVDTTGERLKIMTEKPKAPKPRKGTTRPKDTRPTRDR